MTTKDKIKNFIGAKNPLAIARCNQMRDRLENQNISLLCPNCIGGILFHDLGLQFLSPTVNTMMTQTDFLELALHLKEYLAVDLDFYNHPEYSCPCAKLHSEGLKDITVIFTHYTTEEEAAEKWYERRKRVNYDNLFIFIEERDGIKKEDIQKLESLDARGILAFTAHPYPDIPYTVFINKYAPDNEVGNILKRNCWNDSREYERYFDFVSWFNQASGKPYDVNSYMK